MDEMLKKLMAQNALLLQQVKTLSNLQDSVEKRTPTRRSPRGLKTTPQSTPPRPKIVAATGGDDDDDEPIKKRLSFSEQMRTRAVRNMREEDDRVMRKDLGAALKCFDTKLANNKFQKKENPSEFDSDLFEDACRPIIFQLLDLENVREPDPVQMRQVFKCYQMCVNIAKKRRYYLLQNQKKRSEEKAKKKSAAKKKTAVKREVKKTAAKKKTAVKREVKKTGEVITITSSSGEDGEDTDGNVSDLFVSSQESAAAEVEVSYECWDCSKCLEIKDCYPEEDRNKVCLRCIVFLLLVCSCIVFLFIQDTLLFRCLKCWKTAQKLLTSMATEAGVRRAAERVVTTAAAKKTAAKKPAAKSAAKKPAAKSAAKKPAAKTAAKKPAAKKRRNSTSSPSPRKKSKPSSPYAFELHANVLAKWPGAGFFPAHVFRRCAGKKYHVYFPDDAEVLKGVTEAELKAPPSPLPEWAKMERKRFLELAFTKHEGDKTLAEGDYTVTKLGTGANINKYVCTQAD